MATLYVTGLDAEVRLSSRHLEIKTQGDPPRRAPLFDIDRVALVGRTRVSMRVVHALLRRDIPVLLLSRVGGLVGDFSPSRDGDVMVRLKQYQFADRSAWSLLQAAVLVQAKLMNMRRVLQKLGAGDRGPADQEALDQTLEQLRRLARQCESVNHVDSLRGLEGAGTASYFQQLGRFFPDTTPFVTRSRRPPRDEANALLSFTYTLIAGETKAAVAAVGLDPCLGFYHRTGYGRPALALDLMEPLRAPLCDLFVLRLLNLGILGKSDFERDDETGGFRMTTPALKKYFIQYEKRMIRVFKQAGSSTHTDFRRVIRAAAADYLAALRADRLLQPFQMP